MIRFIPFQSGSRGNTTYLDFDGKCGMILDCGLSPSITSPILRVHNCFHRINEVYLTHYHQDHAKFAVEYDSQFQSEKGPKANVIFTCELPHGDVTSTCYCFEFKGQRVLWMTDFHEIPQEVKDFVNKSCKIDLVLIESNYSQFIIEQKGLDGTIEAEMTSERHHSLEDTLEFLGTFKWDHAHLLHLSNGNAPVEYVQKVIRKKRFSKPITCFRADKIQDKMILVNENKQLSTLLKVL